MKKVLLILTLILVLAIVPFAVMWLVQDQMPAPLVFLGPAAGICGLLTTRVSDDSSFSTGFMD